MQLDVVAANVEVTRWLREVANERVHGTTQEKPAERMEKEVAHLQALAQPWRGDIAAARPQATAPEPPAPRPAIVIEWIAEVAPAQHPLLHHAHIVPMAAYAALGEMARSMAPKHTVAVVAAPGDRRDADLREIGAMCARDFDTIIAYESETRGRAYGETPDLILDGAKAVRDDHSNLQAEYQIHDALRLGLTQCSPGDVLIFTCASSVMELVEALRTSDPETANRIAAERD